MALTKVLEIVIPGKPVSGNHAKAYIVAGKTAKGKPRIRGVRTSVARTFDERIVSIAKAAVVAADWKIPHYVNVDVVAYNCRADRDNIIKETNDPLQGIVYAHDSRILDGRTQRKKDANGVRVVLTISEVDGRLYGFGRPQKSTPRQRKLRTIAWDDVVDEAKRREATKPKLVADILRETKQGGRVTFTVLDELKRTGVLRNGKSVH